MTVESQTNKTSPTPGNSVGFTYSFSPMVIFEADNLQVVTTVVATGVETVRTEGTGANNWALGITSFPATGSITYPADEVTPLDNDVSVTIKRVLTLEQTTDLSNQGPYFPDVQETQFDKLVMIALQQQEEIDRSMKVPLSEETFTNLTIPAVAGAAAGDILSLVSGKSGLEWATPNSSAFIALPLDVDKGGTGVATLTDGGVLLGSGTGDITAMAVLADGEMIVGDGATDPVAESGATLRTSIGVAIGSDVLAEGDTPIGKHTIWVPAAAMRPTVSNGCSASTGFETTAGRPDFQVRYFDGGADEHAQFGIAMPKSWNESTVTFRAVYGVTDAAATHGTDTVAWALQAISVADDASADQAYGTAVVVVDTTPGTVEDVGVTAESSAITIASVAADAITFFRVFRDVSGDDMTEDAGLIGLHVFITTDAGEDT